MLVHGVIGSEATRLNTINIYFARRSRQTQIAG